MGDTTEDMDIEIEQKDINIEFWENKTKLPDSKVFEEMKNLGISKDHPEEKVIGLWIESVFCLIITNTLKMKNKRNKYFERNFWFDNDLFIQATS